VGIRFAIALTCNASQLDAYTSSIESSMNDDEEEELEDDDSPLDIPLHLRSTSGIVGK
jgi:hypothetical protein